MKSISLLFKLLARGFPIDLQTLPSHKNRRGWCICRSPQFGQVWGFGHPHIEWTCGRTMLHLGAPHTSFVGVPMPRGAWWPGWCPPWEPRRSRPPGWRHRSSTRRRKTSLGFGSCRARHGTPHRRPQSHSTTSLHIPTKPDVEAYVIIFLNSILEW